MVETVDVEEVEDIEDYAGLSPFVIERRRVWFSSGKGSCGR